MSDNLTADQKVAREAVHRVIAEHCDQLGPHDDEDETVQGTCLLSAWVLVSDWVDEHGETWTVTLTSENMTRTQKLGLLESHRFA